MNKLLSILILLLFFVLFTTQIKATEIDDEYRNVIIKHSQAVKNKINDDKVYIESLRDLARKQHRESQYLLGIMMITNKIEAKEGIKWLHHSDNNGCVVAAGILGLIYLAGKGVAKNEVLAENWILSAAERGDIGSQMIIATFYLKGSKTLKSNIKEAYSWFYQLSLQKQHVLFASQSKISLFNLEKNLNEKEILEAKQITNKRIKELAGIQNHYCAHSIPL